jgi:UDPglucose 6-dehydrogenase
MKISVFGLGKLGAPLAAVLASKGHEVIGHDVNPASMALLAEGKPPVSESGLADLLRNAGKRPTVADARRAVLQSDITFVVVPTPSDEVGAFSTRPVMAAARAIGEALREKDTYHLVVLTSTVMPGATAEEFVPALEGSAGTRCGVNFGVCYNPEFIALGSVIRDMLSPDFILIGESDVRAGDVLERLYETVCENRPPVARMNFYNAEMAKLALNTFVTMKIAFANVLADLCERLPGGDVDAVTAALGLDSRIGPRYLKGGVGYGGPCFPRDVVAFMRLAQMLDVDSPLAEATNSANERRLETILAKVIRELSPGGTVGVLGLAYKPQTPVTEGSPGVALASALALQDRAVLVYDPAGMVNARQVLGASVSYAADVDQLLRASDVIIVMTPCQEFRRLPAQPASSPARRKVIIDCWRIVEDGGLAEWADLLVVGRGAPAVRSIARAGH